MTKEQREIMEHNKFPKHSTIIENYEDFKYLVIFDIEENEHRSIIYDEYDNHTELCELRIFWIDTFKGLGYGIAEYFENKRIVFYKFGSKELWDKTIEEVEKLLEEDNICIDRLNNKIKYEVLKSTEENLILKYLREKDEEFRDRDMKRMLKKLKEITADRKISYFKWYGDIKKDTEAILEIEFE